MISIGSTHLRSNAVVEQLGDTYRDTMVLTVRGDGADLPPFFIKTMYKNASYASGRRPAPGAVVEKGMTNERMKEYIDFIAPYVGEPSVLLLDRHSSHTSKGVLDYISSLKLPDGRQKLHPKLLSPKTAFLLSPLDMGAIGAMKQKFYKLDRSTPDLKRRAALQAWHDVSNASILSFFRNCGLIGKERLRSIRQRFMKEVRCGIPPDLHDIWNFYDAWKSGSLDVEGVSLPRDVPLERPLQLRNTDLDGIYWNNYGPHWGH
jgi:hypothetical protein